MSGAAAEFFDELGRRGHEPLLEKMSGTIRFDIVNGKKTEHWFLTVDRGDVSVSRRGSDPDCTIRADSELFAGVARGEVNAVAAVLRGALTVEGDWRMLVLVRRLSRAAGSGQ